MLGKYFHQYHQENLAHPPFEPLDYQVPIWPNPQNTKHNELKQRIRNTWSRVWQQIASVCNTTEKLHLVTK